MLRLLLLALLGASLLVVGCDLQRDHSFRVLKGRLLISNLLRSHGREALWSMRPEGDAGSTAKPVSSKLRLTQPALGVLR